MNASADTYDIEDLYWGGNHHGHGDVIGHDEMFDIHGADVTRSGNILTVDIYTNFANEGLASYGFATASGNGIGFGDLFLADEWTPDTSQSYYRADKHNTGTNWDYGFSLDNRWDEDGGSGTWYSLDAPVKNTDTLLSNDFLTCCTYRDGQEVAVDLASSYISELGSAGSTWMVDPSQHKISFIMDVTGTSLESSMVIGLHWGMTCANDTIEGFVINSPGNISVPAPGGLLLLLLGLMFLAVRSKNSSVNTLRA